MNKAKCKEILQWLIKSKHDLGAADRLMEHDPYLDMAVFHCQQAAEKAIKAYLIYRDFVFDKTHNLNALLAICITFDAQFRQWEEAAEKLTPYATEFRYPSNGTEPTKEEAQEAITMAKAIVDFIIQLLPDEAKL